MFQMSIRKAGYAFIFAIGILMLAQTSLALAGDEILGDWEIALDFGERKGYAALSVTKNEDGTLKGKWGSSDKLFDVKYEDGKVSFSRTVGPPDREFTSDYEGTLKDGKLALTMSNDFGELSAVGERPKPMCPSLGQWDINFEVEGFGNIEAKLTISKTADGKLEGKWTENVGEHTVSDIKFENGKLTLIRHSNVEGMEFETTYEGTVKGNELVGKLKNDMGEWEANGKRYGAELVGEWKLNTVSDFGEREGMMRIFGDLSGRYEFFDSEIPMKNIKIDGDQVTFSIEMGWGGQTFQLDFKGKLDGKNLKGQMESDRGTSDVTGKKIEKKAKEKKTESTTK